MSIFREILEGHSVRTPDSVAIEYGAIKWTYKEFNHLSNQVANALLDRGIGAASRVAIALSASERGPLLFFALHKISSVYVPIDPEFPPDRIQAMLEDAAPLLIIHEENDCRFSHGGGLSFNQLMLEAQHKSGDLDVCESKISLDCAPSHIFFTSGTTGRPKGIVATQQNLNFYIQSAIERYGFNHDDIFIAAARCTFSISLFEMVVPIVAGATLRVLDRSRILDMAYLSDQVASATVFHFGPALLKPLIAYIREREFSTDKFNSVRHASSGGDHVPPSLLNELHAVFTRAEVFVIYGSSEVSCMACTYFVPREIEIVKTKVGQPFPGVQLKILDESGEECPDGTPGALYFSSPGVVQQYINLPALNEEKFPMIEGRRYYDIGDVGMRSADGNITLLGRKDFQIKIKGIRIEPNEIEFHLRKMSGVSDCIVTAKVLGGNEEAQILAYLVCGEEISVEAIKASLLSALPNYMVPNYFIRIKKIPTNFNGKVDRSALPDPSSDNIITARELEGLETQTQRILSGIWESLLGRSDIGANSSFLDLGGDSLKSVKMLQLIEKRFGCKVSISSLAKDSSLRGIAAAIDSPVEVPEGIIPLNNSTVDAPAIICLFGFVIYRELAKQLEETCPMVAIFVDAEVEVLQENFDLAQLAESLSFDDLVRRYLKIITSYQATGPYYLCGHSLGGIMALEIARALVESGHTVEFLGMLDTWVPKYFDNITFYQKMSSHFREFKRFGFKYFLEKLQARLGLNRDVINPSVDRAEEAANGNADDFRGHLRSLVASNYSPTKFDHSVYLFRADERLSFDPNTLDLGWASYLPKLTVRRVAGNHMGILDMPNVNSIAESIKKLRSPTDGAVSTMTPADELP